MATVEPEPAADRNGGEDACEHDGAGSVPSPVMTGATRGTRGQD